MDISKKIIRVSVSLLALALLGAVTFYGFVLHGQSAEIDLIESRISESNKALLDKKTRGNGKSDEFRAELSKLKEDLHGYVIGQDESLDFAIYIQELANAAGVSDFDVTHRMEDSYGPIDECVHIEEGRMQVNFSASFSQFATFVNSLERNKPVIFVDNFSISRSHKGGRSHKVTMALSFIVGKATISDINKDFVVKAAGL